MDKICVFLFKRDLRLEDNVGLYRALSSKYPVYPLFILDENRYHNEKQKKYYLHYASLLKKEIEKYGSSLDIQIGNPLKLIPHLIRKHEIKEFYTNNEYEPSLIIQDYQIQQLLKDHGISFFSFKDQVVFEKNELVDFKGKPLSYHDFSLKWKENLFFNKLKTYPSEKKLNNLYKTNKFHASFIDPTIDYNFELRFGLKSIRNIINLKLENKKNIDFYILRDYFYYIAFHYPNSLESCFKEKYNKIKWSNNNETLQAWKNGNTGFPMVDASIRELNKTNTISYEKREIIASFLTKNLLIDWKEGLLFFSKNLIDYDPIISSYSWQRILGSFIESAPYFKIIDPNQEQKRIDPKFIFIKKWIGELSQPSYKPIIEIETSKITFLNACKKAIILK